MPLSTSLPPHQYRWIVMIYSHSMLFGLLTLWLSACGDKSDENDSDGDDQVPVDGDADGHTLDDDCNDADDRAYPGAVEICNGQDDDCDGDIDEEADDAVTWYADRDRDGWGDINQATGACSAPSAHVAEPGDCDDDGADIHPEAAEVCDDDDTDEDCDGVADDDDTSVDISGFVPWFADRDGDGFGDPRTGVALCDPPAEHVEDDTDCDDGRLDVNPVSTELCDDDDTDEDCDGSADDADGSVDPSTMSTWYADVDGDGFGDDAMATVACDSAIGQVIDNTDCDDTRATIHPGAIEVCDADDADEDCDAIADDADADVDPTTTSTWYADSDGDGYGDPAASSNTCDPALGEVANNSDCDDGNAAVNPVEIEVCNSIDDDCDGDTDDADSGLDTSTAGTWYTDADSDGYGDRTSILLACQAPLGAVADATDCDDSATMVNPGANEVCDATSTDDDCDGYIDSDGITSSSETTFGAVTGSWTRAGYATYGNFYLALESGRIQSVEIYGRGDMWYSAMDWYVYEAPSLSGPWTQIATSRGATFTSSWPTWASSGDIDADIVSGMYYFVGAYPHIVTDRIYYDSSPTLTASSSLEPLGYDYFTSGGPGWSSTFSNGTLFVQKVEVGPDSANEDADGDGWSLFCGDCDDEDAAVSPDTGCP